MFRQTDPLFPVEINKFGCYFVSLLYLAEKKANKIWTFDQIEAIYKSAILTKIIDQPKFDKEGNCIDGCFVNDPISLFALCGVRVQTVIKTDSLYVPKKNELELICFYRGSDTPKGSKNSEHTHFVAGNLGQVAFDPIENSNTVKFGYIKSKRIFA